MPLDAARDRFVARPWPEPGELVEAARRWMGGVPVMSLGEQLDLYRSGKAGPRGAYVSEFGFSLPSREALAAISAPIVEIGAGCATWTALLRLLGVDAIATDGHRHGDSWERPWPHEWAPVEIGDAERAVADHQARDVLCSYPTDGADWLGRAMAKMAPGRTLFLIIPAAWNGQIGGFDVLFEQRLMAWEFHHDRFLGLRRPY